MKLSSRGKALLPGLIFSAILAIFYLRFGALILMLTILPSILAYFIDHREGKPIFKIIAACNFSSALPFIVPIITHSLKKHYSEAGQVVEDPVVWLYIYCGALAGAAMFYLSKVVARMTTLMHYEYSIKVLEKKQDMLIKEWGDGVSGNNKPNNQP